MKQRESERKRIWDYGYAAAFTMVFLFLIWKCRYGYANIDEAFYLTIPYRLCLGDTLLIHEWHLSQLSGFLLFPIMKVYLWLFHSTEGILLHYRWLYTLIWGGAALFIDRRLVSYSKTGAHVASLVFLIYAPFGIMALSYNSMGILTLLCACVIILTARTHVEAQYILGGVLTAYSVLCCPYNLAIYGTFTIISLLFAFRKQRQLFRCWLYVTAGSFLVLCVFCLFVFRGCPVNKLPGIIAQILDDPEHRSMSLVEHTRRYCESILRGNRFAVHTLVACGLFIVIGRCRKDWRPYCFAGLCVFICLYLLDYEINNQYLNFLMFPMTILGLYCAATSASPSIRRLFWGLWLPGVMYTFMLNISSNQLFYAISSAATLSMVSSIVIAGVYVFELRDDCKSALPRRIMAVCLAVVFTLQIGAELHLRYTSLFWEPESMAAQTVRTEYGPEKGIYMTSEREKTCRLMQETVRPIKEDDQVRKVLFASKKTMLYLYAEKAFATFSAWLSGVGEHSLKRLDAYYSINPDKLPDCVYFEIPNEAFYNYFLNRGYTPEPHESYCFMRR